MIKKIIFLFVFIYSINLNGQTLKNGDSTIVEQIKRSASWIYENKDQTLFFLTNKQLLPGKTHGTSLTVHKKDGSINRVVAMSITSNGQIALEFYFESERLIYIYQTFEFFAEEETPENWKNFKGIAGWESRYYFINNEPRYQKHIGKKALASNRFINDLQKSAQSIIKYVTENSAKK